MKTHPSCFWLQALDNESPDFIRLGDEDLDKPEDSDRREMAIRRISDVTGFGYNVFAPEGGEVSVWWRHKDFVVAVSSTTRDKGGRIATVQFCSDILQKRLWTHDYRQFVEVIRQFGEHKGLTFSPSVWKEMSTGLDALKKKLAIGAVLLVVLLALGIWWARHAN